MKSKMKKKTEYSNLVVVWVFGIVEAQATRGALIKIFEGLRPLLTTDS